MSAAPWGKSACRTCRAAAQVQPVLRVGGRAGQRFLEKRHADSLEPTHVLERRRRPGLVLDHLREQRQADRRDLAVLGQLGDRLIEEPVKQARSRRRETDRKPGRTLAAPSARGRGRTGRRWRSCRLSTSRISSARMNRAAAIAKSSRTSTRHWTLVPSHCLRARTSSPSPSSGSWSAWSHCSNWSSTIKTFCPAGSRARAAHARDGFRQAQAVGPAAGDAIESGLSSRVSVVPGDAST